VIPALRVLLVILALVFAALIVWAIQTADFWASFAMITKDPWGIVSLADLYLGFIVAAVVMALVERSWTVAPWIVAIFFLGNVVTAIWFAWKLPKLIRA
jgi:hypothetical protein